MTSDINLIYDTKKLMLSRYPRFASEIATANIEYRTNLKYHTAATDGKDVFLDPDYFTSLSEEERLFLIAHELMHIKFAHAYRLLEKDGKKRDPDIWNEATDAIINANLERDGFTIKEGYVNRPEALKYSAEEFYQLLLKEKENKDPDKEENRYHGDDHSMWEEAFEKHQHESKRTDQGSGREEEQSSEMDESTPTEVDERSEFSKNRIERKARARENLERMREQLLKEASKNKLEEQMNLGDVGESKKSIDWTVLIRREIERSETVWSQRRSIAENNYAYRLEENDIEDEAETEVMIDVSGSVDLDLVKGFLRMLKPLLRHSKLRVGCFNEKFWGMSEIKSNNDIDNFVIPSEARGSSAWTEDWDLAVRSFSKKREINKIVFTDGDPCPGNMPKEDLKNENILWLVYGNEKFNPCCGKVINITEEQLEKLNSLKMQTETTGRFR